MTPIRVVLCVLAVLGVCAAQVVVPVTDDNVKAVGRHNVVHGTILADSPGFSLQFSVTGAKSALVNVSMSSSTTSQNYRADYFEVEIDGERVPMWPRLQTDPTQSVLLKVAGALDPSKTTTIRLVKSTEAEWNARQPEPNVVVFSSIVLDAGKLVPTTVRSPLKLEFVGDSITAGYCNLCHTHSVDGDNAESFYDSWASRICRLLKTDNCQATAWSGFGMARNCCGGTTFMPEIFRRTLATVPATDYDYSFHPDAIVVNLGTNDHLAPMPDPFDTTFTNTYIQFVMDTHAGYGNDPTFFLACGPMSTAYCPEVDLVIANVTTRGVKAHFLDQRGFLNSTNTCCGHPAVAADIMIAAAGAANISATLGL